jgi:hypothetical protein
MDIPNIGKQRSTEEYGPEIVESSSVLRTITSSPSEHALLMSHSDDANLQLNSEP